MSVIVKIRNSNKSFLHIDDVYELAELYINNRNGNFILVKTFHWNSDSNYQDWPTNEGSYRLLIYPGPDEGRIKASVLEKNNSKKTVNVHRLVDLQSITGLRRFNFKVKIISKDFKSV